MTATLAAGDRRFACMGGEVRLLSTDPDVDRPLRRAQAWLQDAALRLSRFEPDSELSALNADRRSTVAVSPLLRAAVAAMLRAAQDSGGLVDPTLLPELEAAGYRASRACAVPLALAEALALAPPRTPAQPRADARWRQISVDARAGTVTRPPGLRLDTGGTAKGLLADIVARRLAGLRRVAVDCGGDVRVAGPDTRAEPMEIEVAGPTGVVAARLWLGDGAIATSGLGRNVWRTADGAAHHLLDPASGAPAWTGLVGTTAIAPTALEAETRAKAALLSGPDRARRVLAAGGGLLFHDDGRVEAVGLPAGIVG